MIVVAEGAGQEHFDDGQADVYDASGNRIQRFFEILNGAGIVTITRRTRGDDIDAACGQLAGEFMDRTRRRERSQQKHRAVAQ